MLQVDNREISTSGKILKTAKLRHEWFDSLENPLGTIEKLRNMSSGADLFTFVPETCDTEACYPFYHEPVAISVLTIKNYDTWWDDIHYKTRNKVRRGRKGVTLRLVELDEELAKGVSAIYNESPIRQGRKFVHYGQTPSEVMDELRSFFDRSYLIGAYYEGELIGFMKLIQGKNVLRTVHFIASLNHREKPVMDALIAEAVALCDKNGVSHLHYGSWAEGGIGVFREKHGFVRLELPRYYVPLSRRGWVMLKLKLHRPIRERLPKSWKERMTALRAKWNSFRHQPARSLTGEMREGMGESSAG
jgi:hypothetical protein